MTDFAFILVAGFLPGIFQGGRIYCHAIFFCYAIFSIVFGPNLIRGGGQTAARGAPPGEESQVISIYANNEVVWQLVGKKIEHND